jgi:DNA-binding transcriptional regulator YdaS (Cro superfamily)
MADMNTQTLLETIGGQAAIARECDVTDSAVSQWAKDDKIPSARLQYLRLAHPGAHWAAYDAHLKASAAVREAAGGSSNPDLAHGTARATLHLKRERNDQHRPTDKPSRGC